MVWDLHCEPPAVASVHSSLVLGCRLDCRVPLQGLCKVCIPALLQRWTNDVSYRQDSGEGHMKRGNRF